MILIMNDYNSLLLDPRWIKKRNSILKRDKYKCTCCGSNNSLCVHHTFYYKYLVAPWEYPNSSLLTLCFDCHNNYHKTHEIVTRDNTKSYYNKPWNRKKRDKGIYKGIRYPKNLSLAGKVEFRKKWLERKKDPLKKH